MLAYLEEVKSATPFDEVSRCSIPQLEEGGVNTQICAVFTETVKGSSQCAEKQIDAFSELPPAVVRFAIAIENASALLEEEESFSLLIERLDIMPKPVYISLTWNDENRFGGGNKTDVGLKKDGKLLLDLMDKSSISLDLSHTSDALAHEALNYIDSNSLEIPVIASHSNSRKVHDVKRNLPDELIQEIIRRKGLIGLNGITHFLGGSPEAIVQHIEHIVSLGGEEIIGCGADFFGGITLNNMNFTGPYFFDEFKNASLYQDRLQIVEKAFGSEITEKLACKNAQTFFKRLDCQEIM